jgi:hypothetical protein
MKKNLILVSLIVLSIVACSKKNENDLPQLKNTKSTKSFQLSTEDQLLRIDTPYRTTIKPPKFFQLKLDTPYLNSNRIDTPYIP